MKRGKIRVHILLLVSSIFALVAFDGCTKSDNPIGANGSGVPVSLAASFSKSGQGIGLLKSTGSQAADSIRIDSLVVVVDRIRFFVHVDTVAEDTTGRDEDHHGDRDSSITFRGPFVVRVRDTLAVDFGTQILPAGVYDGIMVKIRRLSGGERFEECDRHGHHPSFTTDTSVVGSSVVVWGAVLKNGSWTPFVLNVDVELDFKIKGNFVIQQATGGVRFALNFNLGLWFKDPMTGAFLDPTDSSFRTKVLIRRAIQLAFGRGHGGHDWNGDGHPDD